MFHGIDVSNFVMHGSVLASHPNDSFWKRQLSITCLLIIKHSSKPLISAEIPCSGYCRGEKKGKRINGLCRSPSPEGESVPIPFLAKHIGVTMCYGKQCSKGSTCKVIIIHYPGFK